MKINEHESTIIFSANSFLFDDGVWVARNSSPEGALNRIFLFRVSIEVDEFGDVGQLGIPNISN